ncbi:MAG: hypothetical protein J7K29_03070 [Candidatus Cloacimonetes bacterium]|nr:hypothetical protein [Candidatus Cloacimonadota bacterium]
MAYESELEQQRIHEQVEKERTKPSLLSKISYTQILFFIGIIAFIFFYITSGGKNVEYVYFLLLLMVLLVLANLKKNVDRKLTEEEARAIAYAWLKNRQKTVPGFIQGTILFPGPAKEHTFQHEPDYWEFYVQIRDLDYRTHKYSVAVYSIGNWIGHIKHFRPRPGGWTGEESPDLFKIYVPRDSKMPYNPPRQQFKKIRGWWS